MADNANPTNKSTSPKAPLVAAVDPNQAFRHMIETERMVALQHESLIKIQLDTLLGELSSTRTVIAACDAALERSATLVPVTDPSVSPALAQDPPIPAFLSTPNNNDQQ